MTNTIDTMARLGDMDEHIYRNTLAIATLIEMLTSNGVFTREEFARTATALDNATLAEIAARRRARRPLHV